VYHLVQLAYDDCQISLLCLSDCRFRYCSIRAMLEPRWTTRGYAYRMRLNPMTRSRLPSLLRPPKSVFLTNLPLPDNESHPVPVIYVVVVVDTTPLSGHVDRLNPSCPPLLSLRFPVNRVNGRVPEIQQRVHLAEVIAMLSSSYQLPPLDTRYYPQDNHSHTLFSICLAYCIHSHTYESTPGTMAKHITLKDALKTERLTPFGNAVAGAMGAVVSSALVYPLDTSVQSSPSLYDTRSERLGC